MSSAYIEVTPKSELRLGGLDALLGYRLRRAQGSAHRDYIATVAELKLTQKQTAVLWLVACTPGVAQVEIGAALAMDRATTMAVIDRLEERGLVVRKRSSADARRRELSATAAGERLLAKVKTRIASHESRMKSRLSSQELDTLMRLLQKLQQADES